MCFHVELPLLLLLFTGIYVVTSVLVDDTMPLMVQITDFSWNINKASFQNVYGSPSHNIAQKAAGGRV